MVERRNDRNDRRLVRIFMQNRRGEICREIVELRVVRDDDRRREIERIPARRTAIGRRRHPAAIDLPEGRRAVASHPEQVAVPITVEVRHALEMPFRTHMAGRRDELRNRPVVHLPDLDII
jgi:hypothetical protein